MRRFRSRDGVEWGVEIALPGASNAMIIYHHPDGRTARLDRYNWYLSKSPEARSVTATLSPEKVLQELDDGRHVEPSELVGPPRPGRSVVITGDTRPCDNTVEAARNADLLVHEATFGDEEAERAVETGHSTAREAGIVARRAGCRRLLLSHFSARYSRDAAELESQARAEFPDVAIGKDGMQVEVPYR